MTYISENVRLQICKAFPPTTDRGKKHSQYAGMTKEEYQSSEVRP